MSKIQLLQKRITAAVARARALGYELVARGQWGADYKRGVGWVPDAGESAVCICGAIALAENPKDGKGILHAIAKKFHITIAQAASLSDGFENYAVGECGDYAPYPKRYTHDKTWYRIGRKWRDRADRVEPW